MNATILLEAVNIMASTVVGISAIVVGRAFRNFDRLKDRAEENFNSLKASSEAQVHSLGKSLHDTNTKLIDERFERISHDVDNHAKSLIHQMDEIKTRLRDGDVAIGDLDERDHQLELKTVTKLETLKDFIRDNCANRADLRQHEQTVAHKFDQVGERIGNLATKVEVASAMLNPPAKVRT